MAYGTSRKFVKARGSRPSAASRGRSAASRQRSAKMSAVRSVANARTGGFVGRELKFYDTSRNQAAGTTANASAAMVDPATVLCLSAPAQGDGESDRNGRKISMKNIFIKGKVYGTTISTAGDHDANWFVALVLDTQTNGAQCASENIFTNPSGQVRDLSSVVRNLEHSKRFKVLDRVHIHGPSHNWNDGVNDRSISAAMPFTLSAKDLPDVTFTANTAGVASVSDNSLHIVAYCDQTYHTPFITYNSRLRYVG
jgi:hypothetical protein